MMTGEEYKASLFDGRATFFEGKRVDDIPAHPYLGPPAQQVADDYDWLKTQEVDGHSPISGVPTVAGRAAGQGRSRPRRRDDGPRHVHVDHDPGDGAGKDGRVRAAVRRAHRRLHQGGAAHRHPHHPVHHRRQGRSLAAAVAPGRPRRLRPRRRSQPGRRRHPRRQAAHHRGVARPRPDDDPDQVDEGRRGGLRRRRHGPGQRARREDHQHDVPPAPRGHARLPDLRRGAARRRASSSSTTSSCPTSACCSTARCRARRCSPTRSGCGSGSAA